ncbi:MAG: hypothetical protein JW720_12900 [Sedimentisphaerales bacterium]|nr:hypothetical protein [Sedimentisphaerales bacterium]
MSVRIFITVLLVIIVAGCSGEMRKKLPVCAGKRSVEEAVVAVAVQSAKAAAIKTTGHCRLEYYVEDKRKPEKESFPVKLWVNPPAQMALYGNVALDARGIVLGSNSDEFWLAIKPKISSYWQGQWAKNTNIQTLLLSPRILLESLGVVSIEADGDGPGQWSLTNEGPFDILTRNNESGLPEKKIYLCSCDYLVRKIEYFGEFGRVRVVVKLDEYEQVGEAFRVPSLIEVVKRGTQGRDDRVRITLKSVKPTEFSEKQSDYLFQPKPGRFKHVYEVIEGKSVELIE